MLPLSDILRYLCYACDAYVAVAVNLWVKPLSCKSSPQQPQLCRTDHATTKSSTLNPKVPILPLIVNLQYILQDPSSTLNYIHWVAV